MTIKWVKSDPLVMNGEPFCYGTRLTVRFDGMPDAVWVSHTTFDGDPGVRPGVHMFVGSKADWEEIADGLPQYPEYGPMGG